MRAAAIVLARPSSEPASLLSTRLQRWRAAAAAASRILWRPWSARLLRWHAMRADCGDGGCEPPYPALWDLFAAVAREACRLRRRRRRAAISSAGGAPVCGDGTRGVLQRRRRGEPPYLAPVGNGHGTGAGPDRDQQTCARARGHAPRVCVPVGARAGPATLAPEGVCLRASGGSLAEGPLVGGATAQGSCARPLPRML